MQYGVLIGRFQPLHKGHMGIIDQILRAGLTPLIFIGSSNTCNDKNPFSYVERASLIHSVYGEAVVTLPLPDYEVNYDWSSHVINTLYDIKVDTDACTLYFYHKEGDEDIQSLLSFMKRKNPESVVNISSSEIRECPVAHRKHMHVKVYDKVIETLTETEVTT